MAYLPSVISSDSGLLADRFKARFRLYSHSFTPYTHTNLY